MKQALCGAILALAAASASAEAPARTTPKGVEPFARCFANAQDRAARPWWFVPKADGGATFSNAGATGVREPYFLDIADKGEKREIRLSGSASAVRAAVDRCA